jgi:hypothetical protein
MEQMATLEFATGELRQTLLGHLVGIASSLKPAGAVRLRTHSPNTARRQFATTVEAMAPSSDIPST